MPTPTPTPTPIPTATPPPPLAPPLSDYRGQPELAIPMRFVAPSIGVDIPLYAVGLTAAGAMDAPEGPPSSPKWHQGFWYRGGVEPGQLGTATLAGHLDDNLGRPGAFWNLRKLQVGQTIEVLDQRSGTVLRFRISETDVYNNATVNTAAVLERIFGVDAVAGRPPGTTPETVARLAVITCTGTFTRGEYDHRYVAYAERIP
ncbi:MAG TPA: class F sortase [Candidatus Dormibacteraeota bacterium]